MQYQWFRNGIPVEGATSQQLEIASFDEEKAGSYSVAVGNGKGSARSEDIRVDFGFPLLADVVGSGAVTMNPAGGIYFQGTVVTLNVSEDSALRFDRWSEDVSSTQRTVTVTIDGPTFVTANFGSGPGSVIWKVPIETENENFLRLQVTPDGTVLTTESARAEGLGWLMTRLLAIDGATGKEKWRTELLNGMTTPAIGTGGDILVGTGHTTSCLSTPRPGKQTGVTAAATGTGFGVPFRACSMTERFLLPAGNCMPSMDRPEVGSGNSGCSARMGRQPSLPTTRCSPAHLLDWPRSMAKPET